MRTIRQRWKSDCGLCCIAMMAGKSYDELWTRRFQQKIDNADGLSKDNLETALATAGFIDGDNLRRFRVHRDNWWDIQRDITGKKAMMSVDSLNYRGGKHLIFWDGQSIRDPSLKQKYKWIEHVHPDYIWVADC